jgi:hypothetical protein
VDTLEIIDLNFQFTNERIITLRATAIFQCASRPGQPPLYGGHLLPNFYALDTLTAKWRIWAGFCRGAASPDENRNGVFGMDFDSKGVLWYAVTSLNNYASNLEYGIPLRSSGGHRTRRQAGMGGYHRYARARRSLDERGCHIQPDDILYAVSSNHSLDGPGNYLR